MKMSQPSFPNDSTPPSSASQDADSNGSEEVDFDRRLQSHPDATTRRLQAEDLRSPPRRRVRLPVTLFLITCVSTFWAGVTSWQPYLYMPGGGIELSYRRLILRHWDQGLTYMGCVLIILLTHELGHFFATVLYRIPASLPIFIPLPFITPIGTMGAVIGMDGRRANRKEIFDVGLAGPLAGLVAAIPILWVGIRQLDVSTPPLGNEIYDFPWLIEWMVKLMRPEVNGLTEVRTSQLNAPLMAGWVGLLITGLNMLPVSQLDGGHVVYGLFGRRAHWIARGFIFLAILFVVFDENAMIWSPMVILVILLGVDHPPTADDTVELGLVRKVLGYASLAIPLVCFPPHGIRVLTF